MSQWQPCFNHNPTGVNTMERIYFVDNNSPSVVFNASRKCMNYLEIEQGASCVEVEESQAKRLLNKGWRLETMVWFDKCFG